jgi:MoaA/NifB/PqqE/SkfB family radical SAM enzyme
MANVPSTLRKINERLLPGPLFFPPTHIILGVNNFCNLRCVMCDVGTGNDESNFGANLTGSKIRAMPMELFARILDQICAFCPEAHLGIAYTEPLAWAHLGAALRLAHQRRIHASVTTNGLLLPQRAKELSPGCKSLSVSIDGPEPVHDRIRRRTGSYARAVSGIEAVAGLPEAPEISVFCTVTEHNTGSLLQFMSEMGHLPLKRVGILHNNFVTQDQAVRHNLVYQQAFQATASNIFDSDPARIDLPALSAELSEITRQRYPFPVTIHPHLVELNELTTYYLKPDIFVGRHCNDAARMLMIDSDGEAIPVHGRCYRFPIGNIALESLARIWRHEKLAGLRRALRHSGGLLPACSRCCSAFG